MNVVTVGGGTGTFPVVTALKQLHHSVKTIVAVSDSGGSTGRIRDEFGFQPVGDLRQSLAALANRDDQAWIQKILLYRFEKGTGLKGHNLGNLILTALQDMSGSTAEALRIASKVFRLHGQVIPVTDTPVNLKITYQDGHVTIGEHTLDEDLPQDSEAPQIKNVTLHPDCQLSPDAQYALESAEYIIIGPGDYYASIMAALVTPGFKEACQKSNAKIVYILNLMTRFTQTHGYTAQTHLRGIEEQIGKKVDIIVVNNAPIPEATLRHYQESSEFPVLDDLADDLRVVRAPLISFQAFTKQESDTAHRSLLRHDPAQLRAILQEIL